MCLYNFMVSNGNTRPILWNMYGNTSITKKHKLLSVEDNYRTINLLAYEYEYFSLIYARSAKLHAKEQQFYSLIECI